jgi:methylamine dehydrogenase light chain
MDKLVEQLTRTVAQRTSRRSFLARLGKLVVGGMMIPLLPVNRVAAPALGAEKQPPEKSAAKLNDDTDCEYWKYCAIDGYLCSCCGGGSHDCPPGATPSPTSWVGTCRHPQDGKDYIVSYRDCCGKTACGRCLCARTEGELPLYRTQRDSDLIWCFGAPTMVYHCSTAEIVGLK